MNPADIVADLAESYRKRKILVATSRRYPSKPFLLYKDFNIDFSIPVFDFGMIFDMNSEFMLKPDTNSSLAAKLQDEARDLISDKKFHLPYNCCFFVYHNVLKQGLSNLHIISVVYCGHISEHEIAFVTFENHIYNNKKSPWELRPVTLYIGRDPRRSVYGYDFHTTINSEEQDILYKDSKSDLTAILVGTLLLAAKNATEQIEISETDFVKSVNKGREKGKLDQLQKVISVTLHKSIYSRGFNMTLREISPHNRRGHYRHYRTGKVIFIEDTKVKGGVEAAQNYKVKI